MILAGLALLALLAAGCVSAPPGARAGWSVSLVAIQLGGSQTTVETQNYVQGTNVTQRHSLPIQADMQADTDLKVTPK